MMQGSSKIFYGYIVVLAGFLILLIGWGSFFSFGVFFNALVREFNWTRAETAGGFSLVTLLTGLMAIVMGRLNDRFGPKVVLSICGFFAGMGYLLMSLTETIWHLYLFFGVVVSLGAGGFFVPPTSTVTRWFVKRRSFMTSIVLLGTGFGTMIIPPVTSRLIVLSGWRFTYIVMGVINLIAIITLAQLLKRDPRQVGGLPYGVDGETEGQRAYQDYGFTLGEAIHMKNFWLLCALSFCFFFCINAILAHLVIHATDLGIPSATAATMMTAFGGAGIGRVAVGMFADWAGNRKACLFCFLLMSADMIYLLTATSLAGLYVFAAVMGFSFAGIGALLAPLTADLFGLKSHGLILGVVYASDMVGGTISPVMAGRVFDVTGSYHLAFLSFIAVGFMGSLFVWLLKDGGKRVARKRR
jgi:MFS family permease